MNIPLIKAARQRARFNRPQWLVMLNQYWSDWCLEQRISECEALMQENMKVGSRNPETARKYAEELAELKKQREGRG